MRQALLPYEPIGVGVPAYDLRSLLAERRALLEVRSAAEAVVKRLDTENEQSLDDDELDAEDAVEAYCRVDEIAQKLRAALAKVPTWSALDELETTR